MGHKKWLEQTCTFIETRNGSYWQPSKKSSQVFATSDYAIRHSWDRLVLRAGIVNLKFHDLRHEAISRLFEMGLNTSEVSLISGHSDPRMLSRYTHPKLLTTLDKIDVAVAHAGTFQKVTLIA